MQIKRNADICQNEDLQLLAHPVGFAPLRLGSDASQRIIIHKSKHGNCLRRDEGLHFGREQQYNGPPPSPRCAQSNKHI